MKQEQRKILNVDELLLLEETNFPSVGSKFDKFAPRPARKNALPAKQDWVKAQLLDSFELISQADKIISKAQLLNSFEPISKIKLGSSQAGEIFSKAGAIPGAMKRWVCLIHTGKGTVGGLQAPKITSTEDLLGTIKELNQSECRASIETTTGAKMTVVFNRKDFSKLKLQDGQDVQCRLTKDQ